jgi:hypothetical protein
MANDCVSLETVKSTVNKLEISPSKNDASGYNARPKTTVGGKAVTGKTALPTPESGFMGQP